MKKYLLGGAAAIVLSAGAASAADLPNRYKGPVAPAYVPPSFTWTGFYVGVNAGYGFSTNNGSRDTTLVSAVPGTTAIVTLNNGTGFLGRGNRDRDGFVGGGQIGYNYQFGQGSGFVVGVEADMQYADLKSGRNRDITTGFINGVPFALSGAPGVGSLDYFGTIRGRLGYAFDRVLVYGTGGFAFGDSTSDRQSFFLATNPAQSFTTRNNSDIRTGYAVGGGAEFALPTTSFLNFFGSSAVTIKVEGLYVNLEREKNSGFNNGFFATTPALQAVNFAVNRRNNEFAVVRAGLNYKF